jgi:hypothetical protein
VILKAQFEDSLGNSLAGIARAGVCQQLPGMKRKKNYI